MSVLKKNVVFNFLLSVSQILFPLITFPYASRVLGPEAMGAVSFADNFTTYFLIFSALGIPLYGIREIAKAKGNPESLGKVFSELIFIHLVTSIVSAIILFSISYYTHKLKVNFGLYQIGMAVLLGNVFIAEWFFQGIEKFKYIALRNIAIRIITVALLFLVVHTVEDRNTYYALNLLATILTAITNMYAISKIVKISFVKLDLSKHFRPLLIIFSNSVVTTVYLVFDTIILGFLTNDVNVGYYAAAMRISKLSLAIIGVLSAVLLPRLTIAFQNKDYIEAKSLLNKSMNFVIFLSIPIALGTFCLAEEIILLFAGNDFLEAVDSLKILCFIVIFVGVAQIFSHQILLPLHQERKILFASIFGVFVSLSLNFLLIPHLKQDGAAISSLATEFCVTVILFFYSFKALKIKFPLLQVVQCSVTCLLFFVIKYLVLKLTVVPILVILITATLSAVLYFVIQLFVWKNKSVVTIISGIVPIRFLQKLS